MSAPETPDATHKEGTEDLSQTEEEKAESPQPELPMKTASEPKPAPAEMSVVPETQLIPESSPVKTSVVPEAQPIPEPSQPLKPAPDPTPVETVINLQPGNMVYVPGFGWLESQGEGSVIHDEMMYENGNKVGSMD